MLANLVSRELNQDIMNTHYLREQKADQRPWEVVKPQ